MPALLHPLLEPGLLSSGPVRTAAIAGGIVAVASAVAGVFTVMRGQSFAGHAFSDVTTGGGSVAFFLGLSQFWGFVAFGVGAAALMELVGVQRRIGRDVATGVVLGAGLGVAALFLYLDTTVRAGAGVTFTVLFGSMFALSGSTVPILAALGLVTLVTVTLLARVLLLSTLSPDIAAARGVPVRVVAAAYLMAVAVAVALAASVVGAILSTALLVGPAATGLRMAKGPVTALVTAAATGLAATWAGIVLGYDSYHWPPAGRGWSVSFFVVAFVVLFYLLSGLPARLRERRACSAD